MKKFILLLLVILSCNAYSQDKEPGQYKFRFDNNQIPRYMSSDLQYFIQYNYMLGWHWGAHLKISKSLDINQNDFTWSGIDKTPQEMTPDSLVDSCNIFIHPEGSTHSVDMGILNARAFQFEPTLSIDSNKTDNNFF